MTQPLERLQQALTDRYLVERELGAGGMATVYLARDLRHDRDVALKVLRPELAAVLGAERFLAEIKTTARLQHPNILPLFDSGVADGLVFYVMPFLEGATLRHRLAEETQLALDDAIAIAKAVASALDYAHAKGVIHRDIKPENILFEGGQPVVADFGIALAVQHAGGNRLTETGLSLGTPGYMSPEQATGGKVDGRSDIYALACVTYEMLAGEPPHRGATAQAIIAKVVTERPAPLSSHRDTIPASVDAAVARALAKVPADRFATAGDFVAAMSNPAFGTARPPPLAKPGLSGPRLAGVVGLMVATGAVSWLAGRQGIDASTAEPVATEIKLPKGYQPAYGHGISPDGRTVVVRATIADTTRLLRRQLDRFDAEPIPGTEGATAALAFSPDGRWLVFATGASGVDLFKIATAWTSRPTPLGRAPFWIESVRWADNDTLYLAGLGTGIWSVGAGGDKFSQVTLPDSARGEQAHRSPLLRPDGSMLFGVMTERGNRVAISTPDRRTWTYLPAEAAGVPVAILPSGQLLLSGDGLRAVTLGPGAGIVGVPVVLSEAGTWFLVARNGAAVTFSAGSGSRRPVWVRRNGVVDSTTLRPGAYRWPRLSPDGTRLALGRTAEAVDRLEVLDVTTSRRAQLTSIQSGEPVWAPSGDRVVFWASGYRSNFLQIYARPADGSGTPELVFPTPFDANPTAWSPDGRTLLLATLDIGNYDVVAADLHGGLRTLAGGKGYQRGGRFSPDGRWVVYSSDESGRNEIYRVDYPAARRRLPISTEGGASPLWAPNGREIYYRLGDRVMAVTIGSGPDRKPGLPRELFRGDFFQDPNGDQSYDIAPDGRFLMLVEEATAATGIRVISNWRTVLDRLLPR